MEDKLAASVFISHSSRDRDVAQALCTALEERGIACWLATRDIGPGENFQEAIVRAVQNATVMLLVFTSNANNSDEIKKELALASQSRVLVIPVRTEDVLPNDAFRYELATRQWIDVFQDWDRAVGKLAEHIRVAAGEAKRPLPAPEPAPKPVPSRRPMLLAGAAIVALVLVGGGVLWMTALKPAALSLSGSWASEEMTSPYAANEKYALAADFQQNGQTLTGTITEIPLKDSGGAHPVRDARIAEGQVLPSVIKQIQQRHGGFARPIREGHVIDGHLTFLTTGQETTGDDTHTYHENYQCTPERQTIVCTRQNDTATGGETEHFTLRRASAN